MSWGCLPALRSMKANLTCSHITLPVTAKMSTRQLSAQGNIKLLGVGFFFSILHVDNMLPNITVLFKLGK